MYVDDNTLAFLTFNDVNNPWKDECGNTWEVDGNPAANITKQVKYGTSGCSLHCLGTTSNMFNHAYLNTLKLGRHDFTIDFWVYIENLTNGDDRILGTQLATSSTSTNAMRFPFNLGTFQLNGKTICSIPTQYLMTNKWTHRAMVYVYNENKIYYYVDGELIYSTSPTESSSYFSSQKYLYINVGSEEAGYVSGSFANFQGYIDNVRISNCARWTESKFSLVDMYKFTIKQVVNFNTNFNNVITVQLKNLLKYEYRKNVRLELATLFNYVLNNLSINNNSKRNVNMSYELKNNTKRSHLYIYKYNLKRNINISYELKNNLRRFIKIHAIIVLHSFSTSLKHIKNVNIENAVYRNINITNNLQSNTLFSNYIINNIFSNTKRTVFNNLIGNTENNTVRIILNNIAGNVKNNTIRNVFNDLIGSTKNNTTRTVLNDLMGNTENNTVRNVLNNLVGNVNFISRRNVFNDLLGNIKNNTTRTVFNDLVGNVNFTSRRNVFNNLLGNTENNTTRIVLNNLLGNIKNNTIRTVLNDLVGNVNFVSSRAVLNNTVGNVNLSSSRNVLNSIVGKINANTIRNVLNNIAGNTIYSTNRIVFNNIAGYTKNNTVRIVLNSTLGNIYFNTIRNILNTTFGSTICNTIRNIFNNLAGNVSFYTSRNVFNNIAGYTKNNTARIVLNSITLINNTYRNVFMQEDINCNLIRYIHKNIKISNRVKRRYLKDGALSLFNTYVRFAINITLVNNTLRYVHNYKKPVFAFVTNTKFKLSKKYKTQKQLLEKK